MNNIPEFQSSYWLYWCKLWVNRHIAWLMPNEITRNKRSVVTQVSHDLFCFILVSFVINWEDLLDTIPWHLLWFNFIKLASNHMIAEAVSLSRLFSKTVKSIWCSIICHVAHFCHDTYTSDYFQKLCFLSKLTKQMFQSKFHIEYTRSYQCKYTKSYQCKYTAKKDSPE